MDKLHSLSALPCSSRFAFLVLWVSLQDLLGLGLSLQVVCFASRCIVTTHLTSARSPSELICFTAFLYSSFAAFFSRW